MSIRVSIKNDEPEGHPSTLAVMVVTVGKADEEEQKFNLAAQQSVNLTVAKSQFVMVDEKDDPSKGA